LATINILYAKVIRDFTSSNDYRSAVGDLIFIIL